MRPDPDWEQRWQARIAAHLADAPEPDPQRLAAGLERARSQARRARRTRRAGIGVAAGLVFGSAAAAVGWWSTPIEPEADQPEEASPASIAPEAGEPASRDATDARKETDQDSAGGQASGEPAERADADQDVVQDSPVIYRRAQ